MEAYSNAVRRLLFMNRQFDFLMPSVKKNRENFQIIMEDIMMKITPIAYK